MDAREEGWDTAYLGWSWSNERKHRPLFHPLLRPSNSPSGLHGVAFSHRGVRKVHELLTTSPVLFARPIDHELSGDAHPKPYRSSQTEARLPLRIPKGIIEASQGPHATVDFVSFSVHPPIIVPGVEDLDSDIGGGSSSVSDRTMVED